MPQTRTVRDLYHEEVLVGGTMDQWVYQGRRIRRVLYGLGESLYEVVYTDGGTGQLAGDQSLMYTPRVRERFL